MSKHLDYPPVLRFILRVGLLLLIMFLAACSPVAAPEKQPPVTTLHVVMDENYPPYVFRDGQGELKGITVDQWKLWEERSGVKVEITALPWGEALARMKAGEFDVIDTAFYTLERTQYLDYTDPYAQINIRIFFQKNISGIATAKDLKGFKVAVKTGDASADSLRNQGGIDLTYYDNYEQIIQAAQRKEVNIFVIDEPPALYFLYRYGIQDQFNYSEALGGNKFYRAVHKGDASTLALVKAGFSRITKAEDQEINRRWLGSSLTSSFQQFLPYLEVGAAIALLIIIALVTFNRMLQNRVQSRTVELQGVLASLQKSERRFREAIEFLPIPIGIADAQGNILSFNRKFVEHYGYSSEDIPSVAEWLRHAYPEPGYREMAQSQWEEDVTQAVRTETSTELREYRVTCKDGSQRDVEIAMHPIGDLWVTSFNNVTERKQVGDALRENRRFLADLIEYSGALIFVKDRDGRYELVNRKWEEVTGLKRENVIGNTDETLFPGPVGRQFRENDLEVIKSGQVLEKEEILEGNQRRYFISIKFPVRDESGNVKGICGMTTEITERKQFEAALQESETIFSSFLEHSPVYVFFKDKNIRTLRLSKNYEQMLGVPISEALGKSMDELFPSDLAKSMVADDLRVLNKGERVDVLEKLNGRVYETTKFPIFKDGQPFMLAGFTLDITERKQAEAALRESEAIFSSFLEHCPIYVFFMDKNIRTLRLSKNYEQMFGAPISELLGKTMGKLYPSDSAEKMVADDLRVLNSGQRLDIVEEVGGRLFQTTKFPVLKDGKPDLLIGVALDITDRKHAEEALRESEENYRNLVELSPDTIMVHSQGKIVFINTAGVRLSRAREAADILGLPAIDFVHPDQRTMVSERIRKIREVGEKAVPLEEKFVRLDGTVVDVEVVAMPIHYEGRPAIQVVARDITERKQMLNSLRASEEKYRTLIETINTGIFTSTLEGKFLQANSAIAQMAGYDNLDEFMQVPAEYLYANRADRERIVGELQTQGFIKNVEVPSLKKDGTQYWVSMSAVLLKDPDGKPGLLLGSLTDITERRRSVEVLQQSEKRFRTLIENSADALTLLNADGSVFYEGPTVDRLTGYSPSERLGKSGFDNVYPDDLPLVKTAMGELLATPSSSTTIQFRSIRKDGAIWWTEATATNLLHEASVQAVVVNYRDITERKQAEEKLRESEQCYRTLFEQANDAIFVETKDDRIVDANKHACELLGYTKQELMNMKVSDLIAPEIGRESQIIREELVNYGGKPFESVDRRKDGMRIPVEVTNAVISENMALSIVRDITDRKKAQAALQKSEQRNRAIVSALPDLIFEISADGRFLDCIASDPLRFLVPPEQAIGRRLDELLPSELAALTLEKVQQTLASGEMQIYDYSIQLDQKTDYFESRMTPLGSDSVLALVRKITERKQVEDELRNSERRFRALAENGTDALTLLATNGTVLYEGPTVKRVTGYSAEDRVGKSALETIYPADLPLVKDILSQVAAIPGNSKSAQFRSIRKDGSLWWTEGTATNFLHDPNIQAIVVNYRDVTDRKRAEDELRDSEIRFRILFEHVGVGVALVDIETGRFMRVNQKYSDIVGYTREELERADFSSITHPDDLKDSLDYMERLKSGEISEFSMEKRYYRKDGKIVWVLLIVSPLLSPGRQPETHIAVVHDITERKRTEYALQYSEAEVRKLNTELERRVAERTLQLEVANKELEAFSYSVSHDLRAPLRTIDGFSRIILDEHASRLDSEVRELLQHIKAESQRMGQLIDALLNLSRMSRAEIRHETVDLSSLAHQVVNSLRQSQPQRLVECVITEGATAHGDARLLLIVLENLLGNAWKFTSRRELAHLEFGLDQRENELVYFVRDDGAGFDLAYADKLFGAFQRLHRSDEFEGTGIGLATVRRIILRHGGRVWAEAEVGKGATFYFTLG